MPKHRTVHPLRLSSSVAVLVLLASGSHACSMGRDVVSQEGAAKCPPAHHTPASATPNEPSSMPAAAPVASPPLPVIQIALLLDTSGSMEGLIHQARARLWDVVNDFARASKNGQRPVLQVALYQYGSDQLPSNEGFLRCVQPLTSDLDLISDRLFALTISGSAEYCGMAMQSAVRQLAWDSTPATAPLSQLPLRMIIIAGNEEFTQGPVDFTPVAKDARERGILVNTIYCGNRSEGERTGWASAAAIAKSCYSSIDHTQPLAEVRTPFDDALLRFNEELNATYIPFGSAGYARKELQTRQDSVNLAASPSGAAARVASKAGGYYRNSHWDLVDAKKDGKDIASIPTAELPEIMRPMTLQERLDYISAMHKKREALQRTIADLDAKRREFLARHRPDNSRTLDSAIIACVRSQAQSVGFTYSRD